MRYALSFTLCAAGLTAGALLAFDHITISGAAAARADGRAAPAADTLPTPGVVTPNAPSAADYARFAKADLVWRAMHARHYTIAELRARGDGRRTARDSVTDRVFRLMRSGRRTQAIAALEAWVSVHPTDGDMLLSLARLLSESGRADDAIARYRQILALHAGGE